jgi:hypothetical protein
MALDEAVIYETGEGLPDRGTTDTELLAERRFGRDGVARPERTAPDILSKMAFQPEVAWDEPVGRMHARPPEWWADYKCHDIVTSKYIFHAVPFMECVTLDATGGDYDTRR